MDYTHHGRTIDLWVSRDCKIGSLSKNLGDRDVLEIMRDFQDRIGIP
mgnify:CR=1 FL=1